MQYEMELNSDETINDWNNKCRDMGGWIPIHLAKSKEFWKNEKRILMDNQVPLIQPGEKPILVFYPHPTGGLTQGMTRTIEIHGLNIYDVVRDMVFADQAIGVGKELMKEAFRTEDITQLEDQWNPEQSESPEDEGQAEDGDDQEDT